MISCCKEKLFTNISNKLCTKNNRWTVDGYRIAGCHHGQSNQRSTPGRQATLVDATDERKTNTYFKRESGRFAGEQTDPFGIASAFAFAGFDLFEKVVSYLLR